MKQMLNLRISRVVCIYGFGLRSLSRRTCLGALTERLVLVLTSLFAAERQVQAWIILNLVILPVAYVHQQQQQEGKSYRRSSVSSQLL
jgi:hypothetical protein